MLTEAVSTLDFSSMDAKRAFILLANAPACSKEEEADLAEAAEFWGSEFGDAVRAANDDVAQTMDRDRPLGFDWRVDDRSCIKAGFEPSGDKDFDRCVKAIMAQLVRAGRVGEWVSYSRNRNFYRAATRYFGLPYNLKFIVLIVDLLLQLGLIEEERAKRGDHKTTKRQSRMRATQKLLLAFSDSVFTFDPIETIRLRDADGNLKGYEENAKIITMRRDMARINTFHKDFVIELTGEQVVRRGDLLIVGGAVVRTGPIFMYRSFCRESFVCGGRLYGFWQNIPSTWRKRMLIDGKPVCELDFRSMHIALLYARRGLRLEHDPYEVVGFERDHAKLAFLVVINACSRRQAICALMHATFKDKSKWPHDWAKTSDLIDRLIARNPEIADDVCSDKGVRLMFDDSEIAVRIIKACMRQGFPCLPVHDSFIAPLDRKDELDAIMKTEMARFERQFSSVGKVVVSSGKTTENAGMILTDPPEGDLPPSRASSAPVLDLPNPSDVPPSLPRLRPEPSFPAVLPECRLTDPSGYFEICALSGRPLFDEVEAARRRDVYRKSSSSEYIYVPGELERGLWDCFGSSWRRVKAASDKAAMRDFHRGEIFIPPLTLAECAANRRLPIEEGGSGWVRRKTAA